MPSVAPTATPTPAAPVPTARLRPFPTATTEPVQPVIPQGEVIGSGSFTSDTGTPLNLRADWTATVLDSERVEVTVNVYLVSYQIEVRELSNAVNVSVGDQSASADSPAIKWENNTRLETLLASTVHTLSLPSGSSASFPLAAQYQFGGTYSKVELPVIECGGTIELQQMRTQEQVNEIVRLLMAEYPLADCTLDWNKDYELLFSVRLAAQCTDERVNKITPALFARFPTLEAFAEADVAEVEEYVRSCGFYHSKARDIVACANVLLEKYGGSCRARWRI